MVFLIGQTFTKITGEYHGPTAEKITKMRTSASVPHMMKNMFKILYWKNLVKMALHRIVLFM